MTDDDDDMVEEDEGDFFGFEDDEEEEIEDDPFEEIGSPSEDDTEPEVDTTVTETDDMGWESDLSGQGEITIEEEELGDVDTEPELEPLSPRQDLFNIRRYQTGNRSTSDEMLRIEVRNDDHSDPDIAFAPIRKRRENDDGVPTREIVDITEEVYYDLDGMDIDMLEEAIEEFFYEEGKSKGNFEIFRNF